MLYKQDVNKIVKLAMLLAFNFSLSTVFAQESINTSGGNASGNGGSISYSVGQIAYQTYANTNGSIAEGVQQPYEIIVISAIEEAKAINLSLSAYPNPAKNYLLIEVEDIELSSLSFKLFDINGKLLQNEKITGKITSINMSDLQPAIYFVKIIQKNNEVKTFKIFKNQ